VIDREGHLQAVWREPPPIEQRARVVDEDIDARLGRRNLSGRSARFSNAGEIGVDQPVWDAWSRAAHVGQRCGGSRSIASDEDDPRSLARQLRGSGLADTGRTTGNDDDLALRPALPSQARLHQSRAR
jgi:hypothetical protein